MHSQLLHASQRLSPFVRRLLHQRNASPRRNITQRSPAYPQAHLIAAEAEIHHPAGTNAQESLTTGAVETGKKENNGTLTTKNLAKEVMTIHTAMTHASEIIK